MLYSLCCALSLGVVVGFFGGAFKMRTQARQAGGLRYSEERVRKATAFRKRVSTVLEFVTMLMLALGLIWCVYYLILGAVDSSQAEYATAMSQLIVSVLTIVSIIFAFFEFVRAASRREAEEAHAIRKDDDHERDR